MLLEHLDEEARSGELFVVGRHSRRNPESIRQLFPDKKIIAYQSKQMMGLGDWRNVKLTIENLRGYDEVWDCDPINAHFLAQRGIVVHNVFPFVHASCLEKIESKDHPSIDVLFYGEMTDRRSEAIARLQKNCPNLRMVWVRGDPDLDRYISDSKVVLNIHAFEPWNRQEQARIFYPLINGKTVVSEPSQHEHFSDLIIRSDLESMPSVLNSVCSSDLWRSFGKLASVNFKKKNVREAPAASPLKTPCSPDLGDRNVFIYWVGYEYKLISILRNLIYLHSNNGVGYKVHFINDKNVSNYTSTPHYFHKLNPAHQADFVRVNVICDYGGIWLDSDAVVMSSIDPLFDMIDEKNGFFVVENNLNLCNGIFGSKKNTECMKRWRSEMIKITDRKMQNLNWTEIDNQLLDRMYYTEPKLYDDYNIMKGLDSIYPVNWDKCVDEFIRSPYSNYTKILRDFQPVIMLVNSVYKELESFEINDIYEKTPLGYFLKKSYKSIT
jgi:hypothetical protein